LPQQVALLLELQHRFYFAHALAIPAQAQLLALAHARQVLVKAAQVRRVEIQAVDAARRISHDEPRRVQPDPRPRLRQPVRVADQLEFVPQAGRRFRM